MTADLPSVFTRIIEHDKAKPELDGTIVTYASLLALREWQARRRDLNREAEAFIVKQRSGT